MTEKWNNEGWLFLAILDRELAEEILEGFKEFPLQTPKIPHCLPTTNRDRRAKSKCKWLKDRKDFIARPGPSKYHVVTASIDQYCNMFASKKIMYASLVVKSLKFQASDVEKLTQHYFFDNF